jgi:hypothetical protein
MPPKAGRLTGFLDVGNREIRDGDLVRTQVSDLGQEWHGSWADYEVLFRNGVWMVSYRVSEKGQVVPENYLVAELSSFREYTGKEWIFAQSDEYRRLSVILVSAIPGGAQ